MKIKDFNAYLDGGTVCITTDEGTYCLDNRIDSTTKEKLYLGYPMHDNGNIVKRGSKIILRKVIKALKEYKNSFYQPMIDNFINKYEIS